MEYSLGFMRRPNGLKGRNIPARGTAPGTVDKKKKKP